MFLNFFFITIINCKNTEISASENNFINPNDLSNFFEKNKFIFLDLIFFTSILELSREHKSDCYLDLENLISNLSSKDKDFEKNLNNIVKNFYTSIENAKNMKYLEYDKFYNFSEENMQNHFKSLLSSHSELIKNLNLISPLSKLNIFSNSQNSSNFKDIFTKKMIEISEKFFEINFSFEKFSIPMKLKIENSKKKKIIF